MENMDLPSKYHQSWLIYFFVGGFILVISIIIEFGDLNQSIQFKHQFAMCVGFPDY